MPKIALGDPKCTSLASHESQRVADQAWEALAQAVAGCARVRVSRDGGRTFRKRDERALTAARPAGKPAAVLIYGNDGMCQTISIDLDSSRGGVPQVHKDFEAITRLLENIGIAWFADESPNGGRHIYLPLHERMSFVDASELIRRVAATWSTVDPMPMLGLTDGCIRPPGAVHKTGGVQTLLGDIKDAVAAVHMPTPPHKLEQFAAVLTEVVTPTSASSPVRHLQSVSPAGRLREPDGTYATIARTGTWDPDRYDSASEARQAVVWAAVSTGMTFLDVARRMKDGTWPGLAAFYARYAPEHRNKALSRDWNKAVSFEKHRRNNNSGSSARVGTTRGQETQGGGVHQRIRAWVNVVEFVFDDSRRDDLAARAVLAALGEAAARKGSLEVEFGNRSLALATGLNQATVGKALKRLSDEEDALIDLIRPASGVRAALWGLRVPESHRDYAENTAWMRGRVRGVRPVFRELGLPAAFVYAALERAKGSMSARELSRAAHLGGTTTREALQVLHAWGLADLSPNGRWKIGTASVQQLAEAFGITEQVAAQLQKYRQERLIWWHRLGIVRLTDSEGSVGRFD
ncbi:MAG: MarR family transcriptional regulator, partial [Actinomycetales bacterium]|nr:MarR family transcriptional regulator [Actinomycetales bacterium]